jgi:hypothetical protein
VAASIMLVLSWVFAIYGFVGQCQCFGETCCLHLQYLNNKAGKFRTWTNREPSNRLWGGEVRDEKKKRPF